MRQLSLLLTALLFSAFAQAATTANISTASCSGSQSSDLSNGAMLSCSGDFSLIGGSIESDIAITISAVDSLFLDDLRISAPIVELISVTGAINLTRSVKIDTINWTHFDIGLFPRVTFAQPEEDLPLLAGGTITISNGGDISSSQQVPGRNDVVRPGGEIDLNGGGQIVLNGGGSLPLVSSVPEPSMFWSLLAGGLLLTIDRSRRKDLP